MQKMIKGVFGRCKTQTDASGKVRPFYADWSLRLRLGVGFALLLCVLWGCVAVFSWYENKEYINEFFDTQQMLFAKSLLMADLDISTRHLPKDKALLRGVHKEARGNPDKHALGFAVFTAQGERLFDDGEKGKHFTFSSYARGYVDTYIEPRRVLWRILWLNSPDGKRIVAVGQEMEYRNDMLYDILEEQLTPWLILLPALLVGFLVLLHTELAPIKQVARRIEQRAPQDFSPLDAHYVPSEIRPLIYALNELFVRVQQLLEKERAFVSDAAHELRTPITGLRIQAELLMTATDATERVLIGEKIVTSIDRCTRLLEQLLVLSRLDALGATALQKEGTPNCVLLDWKSLLQETLDDLRTDAADKQTHIQTFVQDSAEKSWGNPQLIRVLLRNILHNAITYSPPQGTINVHLGTQTLTVVNSGQGVAEEHVARLGERFFRPAGQEVYGCGLGISIIKKIAQLHGFSLTYGNIRAGQTNILQGFEVTVRYAPQKNVVQQC